MIEGHGDDTYKYGPHRIVSNFSSNVFGKADHRALQEHLCRCIQRDRMLSVYPEPEPYTLEQALAQQLHLSDPASVCVTNGATEAIYLIAQAFRQTQTAILQPTFSEYADACRMHGHLLTTLYQLPAEEEGYKLPDRIRMCWICNPNNPTGNVIEKQWLDALIERNRQVCFVVDQSYEDFTRLPLLSPLEAAGHPNVLQLHSMTKRYAVPGLRIGYITGETTLLHRIRRERMPWSVNRLAIEAGLFLVASGMDVTTEIEKCLNEAQRLRTALLQTGGVDVWETSTHFMLARLRCGKAAALKQYLAEQYGLLIRDASNFNGLDEHFFRIAAQTPAENDRLVAAITQWFGEGWT